MKKGRMDGWTDGGMKRERERDGLWKEGEREVRRE